MDIVKQLKKYIGPAFIISVAYVDPGNFATNIAGGSNFNYSLLWVIVWSNVMAIFLQSLSAKLGIATGKNLPQMCGMVFSKKVNWFLWIAAELAAMATDLAEFLGAALGLYLLFGIPMHIAGLITAALTVAIVFFSKYGQRVIEGIIGSLVGVISIAYAIELVLAGPNWTEVGIGALIPVIANPDAAYIAVGMLGATVMPHVIYLHSELVQYRNCNKHSFAERMKHYKWEKIDIIIAMNIALVINAAILIVSAAVFHSKGMVVETIEHAHYSLAPLLGQLSAGAFGVALLASGLSSSAVGTMAGQTIMQGFVGMKISDSATRFITMAPAMLIIMLGINPMQALVMSQVVLSFVLPAAIIPMMIITGRKDVMGKFANSKTVSLLGYGITAIIVLLNIFLIAISFV